MSLNFENLDLQRHAISVVSALVILVVGWLIAGWASSAVRAAIERHARVNPTLVPIFAKATRLALLLIVLVAALDEVGVETGGLFAALGAAGLAVGLALKDTVSDVAAGVVLLVLRPFDVDEAVDIGGTAGIVTGIDILQTRLTSFDGIPIVLNNSAVRTAIIQNFSRAQLRRIDIEVRIGYGDDIDKAKAALEDVLRSEVRVLRDPPVLVHTTALGDSAVILLVRSHTKAADFWSTKLDLTQAIKERLDREGISIPFPQRDVRVVPAQEAPSTSGAASGPARRGLTSGANPHALR